MKVPVFPSCPKLRWSMCFVMACHALLEQASGSLDVSSSIFSWDNWSQIGPSSWKLGTCTLGPKVNQCWVHHHLNAKQRTNHPEFHETSVPVTRTKDVVQSSRMLNPARWASTHRPSTLGGTGLPTLVYACRPALPQLGECWQGYQDSSRSKLWTQYQMFPLFPVNTSIRKFSRPQKLWLALDPMTLETSP